MKQVLVVLFMSFLWGCSATNQKVAHNQPKPADELLEFAKANCFFWYFKKKNYDLEDIRAISGGVVGMGSYSAEKYQQVSLLVKNYSPDLATKQNIDIDLLKCFQLEKDPGFIRSLSQIK